MDSVAIVTAPASADLAVLHHRVPVTIAPDDFERWLDCRAEDVESAMALLSGPEVGEFAWHQVSARVNHAANDDAQLILPITDEERRSRASAQARQEGRRASRRRPSPMTGRAACSELPSIQRRAES